MIRFANTHISPNFVEFVGQSWEEAGYHVDGEGNPTSDCRDNTVAKFGERPIGASDASLLVEAYAGGDRVTDWANFEAWAVREAGASKEVAAEIANLNEG